MGGFAQDWPGVRGKTVDFRDRLEQGRVVSMGMRAWGREREARETWAEEGDRVVVKL